MGKFYLIGEHLSHSHSPAVHAMLGNPDYSLKELAPDEVEDFIKHGDFDGINVTIPYKKTVIPYLDELTDTAKALGAVNTIVRRSDGTLLGDNTDYFGFAYALSSAGIALADKKVLILGSGGASKTAVAYAHDADAASVTVFSRTGEINYQNVYERCADAEIVINCTPVGMYPHAGTTPVWLIRFPHLCGVVDMIYNPARTLLLAAAKDLRVPAVNGASMLVAQAARGHEHFTGQSVSKDKIAQIVSALSQKNENVVLIGMPGCGKTTVGKALASLLGKQFVDTDAEIERNAGKTIPEIFATQGIDAFRKLEHEVICRVGAEHGQIIATGGGAVTRQENQYPLEQNGRIVWLQRPPEMLPTDGRPLSKAGSLAEMYRAREPLYRCFSDMQIPNDGTPDEVAATIAKELHYEFFSH
ncbi:MAG: AAA family ATPase [Clostridia bacterium]|nr:AAA family ATPase [Clostridia bacterium]